MTNRTVFYGEQPMVSRTQFSRTQVSLAKRIAVLTGMIGYAVANPGLAWSQTTVESAPSTAVADTTAESPMLPSWRLGMPTFNGGKKTGKIAAVAEKLKQSTSFQLPSYIYPKSSVQPPATGSLQVAAPPAGVTSAELASMSLPNASVPNASEPNAAVPNGVQPTNYQVDDPLSLKGPSTPSMQLPSATVADAGLPNLPLPSPPEGSAPQGPIGAAIAAESLPEAAPLQEQTTAWYAVPWQWLRDGWENHAEFGLDGSRGNARTLALQTGLEMKRKTDDYTLALDFDYRKATAASNTTEDNGRFNLDYDRLFQDSPWAAFGKFGTEWDQFKSFDLRVNVNGGLGYHWVRTDDAEFVTRFGAGASQEIGALDDDWKAEAVFGLEGERQINRYNKMKAKVDYFPEWADFGNFRLVTDLAWEILLDDSDNLSLKLSLTDRYDSTPQGTDRANDVYYSLLLLVKF